MFREIGQDYVVPLGVWQIRENVRNALKQKPLIFSSSALALDFLSKKLLVPISRYKKRSTIYSHFMQQKRINEWF